MTDEEFEEHVRAALDSLPDDIAEGLENVAVVVEDESPESPIDPGQLHRVSARVRDTLGRAAGEGRRLSQAAPGRVSRPGELQRQIRITVLHEVAHYFGIDEDRIAELGYG